MIPVATNTTALTTRPFSRTFMLKYIVHDWDDEQALSILTNCRTAMAPNGRVLIVEMVVPEGNAEAEVKHLDVTMLVFTGGRERTEHEYGALLPGPSSTLLEQQ